MTAHGYIRGRLAYFDGALWRWQDSNDPAGPTWGGMERPCPSCGRLADEDGHDPCLGTVPGVTSACCGHGVAEPYVVTVDG